MRTESEVTNEIFKLAKKSSGEWSLSDREKGKLRCLLWFLRRFEELEG